MTETSTALARVEAAHVAERNRIGRVLAAADVMANSSLLRADLRKDGNARAAALTLDQLGVPATITNMNACYVVNGAVSMMTWLWCSIAAAIGGHEIWLDEASDAERGIARLRRADTGTVRTAIFTIEDAQRAGLTTGPNKHNYEKYTTDMLGWKALIRVVKRYAPEVMAGLAAAGATPGPVFAPPGAAPVIGDHQEDPDDDEVYDGEIVEPEQGEDPGPIGHATVAPPGPAPDPEKWAAFVRWTEAGEPRDENGFPIDVPSQAAEQKTAAPAEDRDNVVEPQVVGGSAAVPGEWRARAAELGKADALVLKKARDFATERGVEVTSLPRTLDQVTDPADIARLEEWLG